MCLLNFPVDKKYTYSLISLEKIYVYEFIAEYLDDKKLIVEREAGKGEIIPFYSEKMIEGNPRFLVRNKVDVQKISDLEKVFSGIDKIYLPPIILKKVSRGYIVINGMHRFTLALLYRLKNIPAQIK